MLSWEEAAKIQQAAEGVWAELKCSKEWKIAESRKKGSGLGRGPERRKGRKLRLEFFHRRMVKELQKGMGWWCTFPILALGGWGKEQGVQRSGGSCTGISGCAPRAGQRHCGKTNSRQIFRRSCRWKQCIWRSSQKWTSDHHCTGLTSFSSWTFTEN